ncbi:hypothetical protein AAMO2058_000223100 [Amorphochlora amoebiformis]
MSTSMLILLLTPGVILATTMNQTKETMKSSSLEQRVTESQGDVVPMLSSPVPYASAPIVSENIDLLDLDAETPWNAVDPSQRVVEDTAKNNRDAGIGPAQASVSRIPMGFHMPSKRAKAQLESALSLRGGGVPVSPSNSRMLPSSFIEAGHTVHRKGHHKRHNNRLKESHRQSSRRREGHRKRIGRRESSNRDNATSHVDNEVPWYENAKLLEENAQRLKESQSVHSIPPSAPKGLALNISGSNESAANLLPRFREAKIGSQIGTQTEVQTGIQSGTQTGIQSGTQTGIQSGTQTGIQSGTQTGIQSGTQTGIQSGTQIGIQSGAQTGTQNGNQPPFIFSPTGQTVLSPMMAISHGGMGIVGPGQSMAQGAQAIQPNRGIMPLVGYGNVKKPKTPLVAASITDSPAATALYKQLDMSANLPPGVEIHPSMKQILQPNVFPGVAAFAASSPIHSDSAKPPVIIGQAPWLPVNALTNPLLPHSTYWHDPWNQAPGSPGPPIMSTPNTLNSYRFRGYEPPPVPTAQNPIQAHPTEEEPRVAEKQRDSYGSDNSGQENTKSSDIPTLRIVLPPLVTSNTPDSQRFQERGKDSDEKTNLEDPEKDTLSTNVRVVLPPQNENSDGKPTELLLELVSSQYNQPTQQVATSPDQPPWPMHQYAPPNPPPHSAPSNMYYASEGFYGGGRSSQPISNRPLPNYYG